MAVAAAPLALIRTSSCTRLVYYLQLTDSMVFDRLIELVGWKNGQTELTSVCSRLDIGEGQRVRLVQLDLAAPITVGRSSRLEIDGCVLRAGLQCCADAGEPEDTVHASCRAGHTEAVDQVVEIYDSCITNSLPMLAGSGIVLHSQSKVPTFHPDT